MASIAVIEDEGILRLALKMDLNALGHKIVAEGNNGTKAAEIAGEKKPDLIILDIAMADKEDGLRACEQIKKQHPGIKVIFISGYPKETFKSKLSNLCFDGYIEKPAARYKLQECLKNLGY